MSGSNRWSVFLGWVGVVLLAACGGGQTRFGNVFDSEWQDDEGRSIAAVQSKLSDHELPSGVNVAVGVVDDGLIGVVLDTGKVWTFQHALNARPSVTGKVVVGTGGGRVFALDAATGQSLWSRPTTGKLRGAGDDGRTTVVSLEPPTQGSGMIIAVTRDGMVRRQLETRVSIGTPAVVANLAFVPWQNRYVTVYDLSSGDEVARAVMRHTTSHALVLGGVLYFGEDGVIRFDRRIGGTGRGEASRAELPSRELPGKPQWLRPGGEVQKTTSDAHDTNRMFAMPGPRGDGVGFLGGRYYATYFRIVLGFDDANGELAWVRRIEEDSLGGAAYPAGLVLCDRSGDVKLLEASTGALAGQVSLGQRVRSCVVQADGFQKQATPRSEPLVEQLSSVIDPVETKMAMMHTFLLGELIKQESPRATQRLIELASDSRTPPVLMTEIRRGLALRRNGADHMLEALKTRYDFLAGVLVTPPVGPLADALAEMGETRAAPLLVNHLNDPANSTDDVKRAALALEKLATDQELESLETFFGLYRATAHNDDMVTAVLAVAKTLLRVGGHDGLDLIRSAAYDGMTVPSLQQPLRELSSRPSTTSKTDH